MDYMNEFIDTINYDFVHNVAKNNKDWIAKYGTKPYSYKNGKFYFQRMTDCDVTNLQHKYAYFVGCKITNTEYKHNVML